MRWQRRFSVEDIRLGADELKITQSKNGYHVASAVRSTRLVRRRHLLARRLRQTGRDHAVSARGRWAEVQLHYAFQDASLLDLALTHRSAAKANNERLEYLGDSFLNFAIARRLFELRPDDTEGDLSRARAALVKQPTLAAIGLAPRRRRAPDARFRRAAFRRRAARGYPRRCRRSVDRRSACLTAARRRQKLSSISCSPSNSRACPMPQRSRIRKRGCRNGYKAGACPYRLTW